MRFSYERASVEVVPDTTNGRSDVYILKNLYSTIRRHGHATKVMQQAVEWADEHDIILMLLVRAYGPPDVMTNTQLMAFYQKFGFGWQTEYRNEIRMVRYPRIFNKGYSENPTIKE